MLKWVNFDRNHASNVKLGSWWRMIYWTRWYYVCDKNSDTHQKKRGFHPPQTHLTKYTIIMNTSTDRCLIRHVFPSMAMLPCLKLTQSRSYGLISELVVRHSQVYNFTMWLKQCFSCIMTVSPSRIVLNHWFNTTDDAKHQQKYEGRKLMWYCWEYHIGQCPMD